MPFANGELTLVELEELERKQNRIKQIEQQLIRENTPRLTFNIWPNKSF